MAQPMSATNPFLNFPYGPIQMECQAQDLVVEGEVPADLCGTLFRAGPNQRFKPRGDYHLFMGDGVAFPVWAPDGKSLALDVWRDGHAQVHVVDLGTARYRRIPPDTTPLACDGIAIGDLVEIDGRNM